MSLPRPTRSRDWVKLALVEYDRCHQIEQRRSPNQRHSADYSAELRRQRS